jgi:hypothetical protein
MAKALKVMLRSIIMVMRINGLQKNKSSQV